MTGYNQRYHIRCVYRELQLPFIPFFSLSLAYVGNILVRRYRPLTPCCALIFLRTYPAVPLKFFALNYPAVRLFSSRLPCCALIRFTLTTSAQPPSPSAPLSRS